MSPLVPIERAEYADRLATLGIDNPFLKPAWLDAAATSHRGRVRLLAPRDPSFPAVLPVIERRFGPVAVAGSPLRKTGTPVALPMACTPGLESEWVGRIAEWAHRLPYALFQLTSPVAPLDAWCCSRVEQYANLEIDLRVDCEQLWRGLSDLPRRMIRRALSKGMKVHCPGPVGSNAALHRRLVDEVFLQQDQPPIYSDAHYMAVTKPPLRSSASAFTVTRDGVAVGTLWALQDAQRGYYWDVAVRADARADGAGHLLLWTWLRWCKRRGVQTADLIGPPSGGRGNSRPGIGRFKLSFGAVPRDYWILYWHRWWAGKALDATRARAARTS
jgi:hypothetical protein